MYLIQGTVNISKWFEFILIRLLWRSTKIVDNVTFYILIFKVSLGTFIYNNFIWKQLKQIHNLYNFLTQMLIKYCPSDQT